MYSLLKDAQWREDPDDQDGGVRRVYGINRPETLELLGAMRRVLHDYPDRVMVGETFLETRKPLDEAIEELVAYSGPDGGICHLPFNWGLIRLPWETGLGQGFRWEPRAIKRYVRAYEAALGRVGGWPNWVLGNHDQPRAANKVGGFRQARIPQMLLLTLRRTPTCYYGDELGMTNVRIRKPRDPFGLRVAGQGRDRARTPMQWDAGPNAGFCASGVAPLLPVGSNYRTVNV